MSISDSNQALILHFDLDVAVLTRMIPIPALSKERTQ